MTWSYEVVLAPGISWDQASAAANNAGGHLATITSAEENAFVFGLINHAQYWVDRTIGNDTVSFGPFIGGSQFDAPATAADNWRWVTRETWDYTNWGNGPFGQEPNDFGGEEDKLIFFNPSSGGPSDTWADFSDQGFPGSYVIEYPLILDPTDQTGIDPLLGPLADNGGPTQTQALLEGSPALDAGALLSYESIVLADAPIAYYRFEETGGTTATDTSLSATQHNGTFNNGVLLQQASASPTLGNAIRLDGTNDQVRIPDSVDFDNIGTGDYAIELWYRSEETTRGDLFNYKGAGGDLGVISNSNSPGAGPETIQVYHNSTVTISPSMASHVQWNHVVVSRSGTDVTLYLNGNAVSTGTSDATWAITNDLLLGANHSGNPDNLFALFQGYLDEVAIYNGSLSASRVATHYAVGLGLDQRGIARPQGTGVDIGAFELYQQLSVATTDADKDENASPFTFTVTRDGDAIGTTAVDYTVTGTGTHPAQADDFGGTLPSGTVTFGDGETSHVISISVSDDAIVEYDETFTVTLSNPSNPAVILDSQAMGTIRNDDVSDVSVVVSPDSVLEDSAGVLTYTFTRDSTSAETPALMVTVSASGTATSGDDYAAPTATVTFAAGQDTATITVVPTADTNVEADEDLILTVDPGAGYNVGTPALASATITNDDAADFGDAPAPYPTLFAAGGAFHLDVGPKLGTERDTEFYGVPSTDADGDDDAGVPDDEDGVLFGVVSLSSTIAALNVTASEAAKVDAWIDFNQNGVWEASEQILTSRDVTAGLQTLNYTLPTSGAVPGDTFARVRISNGGGLLPTGGASDGEVEDYLVTLHADAAPMVQEQDLTINVGERQRSNLTNVTITFDSEVVAPSSAFQIRHRGTGQILDTLNVNSTVNAQGKTVSVLSFGAGGNLVVDRGNGGNSLIDGNYELTIDALQIRKVGGGPNMASNFVLGDEAADGFFRMYGDQDGDRDVDTEDLVPFGQTFRKNIADSGFNPVFDADGDNDIDAYDLIEFGKRFRRTLPFA